MKFVYLIFINLLLISLNIPLRASNSVMGIVLFISGFGSFFVLLSFVLFLINLFSRKKNLLLVASSFISLICFSIAFYWETLAFDAIDPVGYENVSIWYRLGPSLSFTLGILIFINTRWYLKYKK